MIVTVIAVRVMQTSLDEIVDVISVRNRLMPTIGPVLVTGGMARG